MKVTKRLFLAAAGLLFLVVQSQAQREDRTFQASLVGGFNLSQIDGDKLGGFNLIGLNAGAKVGFALSERWQLGLEMLYSQQGSRRVLNDDPAAFLERMRLNFVEVPLMIHFRDWKILVGAGLSYNRLINFKVEDVTGEDITDQQDFNPNIVSVVLGGTFMIRERLGLNIQWSKYLNDLQANPDAQAYIGRTVSVRLLYGL